LPMTIDDCGITTEPQLGMTMETLVGLADLAEELGFGYFFRSDHLLPTGDMKGKDAPECWTSLGAIAASTNSIRFGPLVTPVGFRNPSLLAKMACTLHSFSKGRLQLAVGAGFYEPEFRAYGYAFPDFRTRVARFQEALDIIEAMVNVGRVDYDGKHFSAHADCFPRPHGHMHLIIGGRLRPVVKLAAKYADEWNFYDSYDMSKTDIEKFRTVIEESSGGRSIDITEMGPFLIAKNQSELETNARIHASKMGENATPKELITQFKARDAPCGTVEEFVEQLAAKADAGIRGIYFQALVPENKDMMVLLADTLKSRI
jgi:alkanesulfonate monooxygenase SsuD/methylene tetrahydromethanopterin reductase-like flavin-dependent oxidoreductase (luciferase family)